MEDLVRVDQQIRRKGWCGLMSEHRGACYRPVHDDDLHVTEAGDEWHAELTDMERRVPIEPTRTRPGDQVLPDGDETLSSDQEFLIEAVQRRRELGVERYGQEHRPFNGRDTLQDLFEEQLDFMVYLTSLKRMSEASREEVVLVIATELGKNGFQEIVSTAMADQIYVRLQSWLAAKMMEGQ